MSVPVDQFWKLLTQSGLHAPADCQRLHQQATAQEFETSERLAEWLVEQGQLTTYQASVLLNGRPGPFVFGPLVVTERIQQGRLARLYRARYQETGVMLVLLSQLTQDASEYPALAKLAALAAEVKHPRVSRTFRATRQNGQAFVILESLRGHSLAEAGPAAPRSIATACRQVLDVAAGLAALHAAQLVHGGISPQNVLLVEDGSAKLLQFPLVPAAERAPRFELPLVNYLAPECCDAEAPATPASDVYALGCLLFEQIAGHAPFAGGNPRQIVERHRREVPRRLDEINPRVSPYLADLVDEMLAKDPALRCASAARVVKVLTPLAAEAEQAVPSQPSAASAALPVDRPVAGAISVPVSESISGENVHGGTRSSGESFEFPIAPAGETASARHSKRGSKRPVLLWIAGGLAIAGLAALFLANRGRAVVSNSAPAPSTSPPGPSTAASPPEAIADEPPTESSEVVASGIQLVEDDGRTLWNPPTAGDPISLEYLPSGAQTLAVVRPAQLLSSPEGPRLVAALGPAGEAMLTNWRQTLGVEPAAIEELAVAFVPDESLQPRAAYRMRLAEALPREQLLAAWGDPAPVEHAGQRYFERNGLAYYFPSAADDSLVVICPSAMMPQMLEFDGQPLLRTSIEKLLATSDQQRLLTLLFVPNFLLTDGQPLLVGGLRHLRPALRELLDAQVDAVCLSGFVDEDFYLEFRAVAPVERKPNELLAQLQSRWQSVAERVESHLAPVEVPPHAAGLLKQLPEMLRTARDYTRGGLEERQAVLSVYLPATAAHNLLMAGELALWAGGEASPGPGFTVEQAPARPAAELLAQNISLSFARETFDAALGVLSREIGLPIVIQGNDLQSEGITRNQSLSDFNERNQPAAAVLRKLLLQANPAGKLVVQIKADAAGRESLLVTTRSAVGRRGERPAEGF